MLSRGRWERPLHFVLHLVAACALGAVALAVQIPLGLSQLQLFLLAGKFESALGMELSVTERIERLDNVFEILQEGKNQTFSFSTAFLEHIFSDKSSSL